MMSKNDFKVMFLGNTEYPVSSDFNGERWTRFGDNPDLSYNIYCCSKLLNGPDDLNNGDTEHL
jgi:hypothetical protein